MLPPLVDPSLLFQGEPQRRGARGRPRKIGIPQWVTEMIYGQFIYRPTSVLGDITIQERPSNWFVSALQIHSLQRRVHVDPRPGNEIQRIDHTRRNHVSAKATFHNDWCPERRNNWEYCFELDTEGGSCSIPTATEAAATAIVAYAIRACMLFQEMNNMIICVSQITRGRFFSCVQSLRREFTSVGR